LGAPLARHPPPTAGRGCPTGLLSLGAAGGPLARHRPPTAGRGGAAGGILASHPMAGPGCPRLRAAANAGALGGCDWRLDLRHVEFGRALLRVPAVCDRRIDFGPATPSGLVAYRPRVDPGSAGPRGLGDLNQPWRQVPRHQSPMSWSRRVPSVFPPSDSEVAGYGE